MDRSDDDDWRPASSCERGVFRLDVALDVAAGEVVALLGPNGAGKTTALRALAGLTALTGGRSRWTAPTSRRDRVRPPESPSGRRGLPGLPAVPASERAGQRGLRAALRRGVRRRPRARTPPGGWTRLGLADHVAAKPPRAVRRPGPARRAGPRAGDVARGCCCSTSRWRRWTPVPGWTCAPELRRHLAEFDGATVLVTHDPLDAMVLADRLVVIEDGRVVQEGTPADIARRPAHGLHRPAGRAEPLPGRRSTATSSTWSTAATSRRPRRCPARCSWRSRRAR